MPRPDWPTAAPFVPDSTDLDALRAAAPDCRGCPLWEPATQVVFGRGGAGARLMLVGEQPGDVEDQKGLPFVGPAGRLLVQALDEAGVDRGNVYVTNAVKHFKFTVSGKRRIHATPDAWEVAACRPWLVGELAAVRPELVVLLGATAAKTVYGPSFRVTRQRGMVLDWPSPDGPRALATIHPSAVLRADDRDAALAGLVADLKLAADTLR
ncbi:MAG TPA: UdgX family uracil-DNA binding protein [Mycobacteriales bacterium]|jgi:DNA polymerase|nr:UdgX family uracil-DNA binding protein [Mycobacteriales bacterium]